MERRPHPTHDRVTFRHAMACFAVAMLGIIGYGVADGAGAGAWSYVGVVVFLAATGWLVLTPVNKCRCPTCGERLSRPPDTTEFPCGRCDITWTTVGFGGSNWG